MRKGCHLWALADLETFVQKPKWIYVGSDFEENIQIVLTLAVG